jgi:hypothetical protein
MKRNDAHRLRPLAQVAAQLRFSHLRSDTRQRGTWAVAALPRSEQGAPTFWVNICVQDYSSLPTKLEGLSLQFICADGRPRVEKQTNVQGQLEVELPIGEYQVKLVLAQGMPFPAWLDSARALFLPLASRMQKCFSLRPAWLFVCVVVLLLAFGISWWVHHPPSEEVLMALIYSGVNNEVVRGPGALSLRIQHYRPNEEEIADGATLVTGEPYSLQIASLSSGYLYVIQLDSAGRAFWLYPRNETCKESVGTNPVQARASMRIPIAETDALKLGGPAGRERLFAVLANRRWAELENSLVKHRRFQPTLQLKSIESVKGLEDPNARPGPVQTTNGTILQRWFWNRGEGQQY